MNSKELHIISFSGGADSTAMLFQFPKEFIYQDNVQIVFCNTTVEFPDTYRFVRDIEKKLGKKIIRIRGESSFKNNFIKNGYFIPRPRAKWCCQTQKHGVFDKYYKQFLDKEIHVYLGFCKGEERRINNNNAIIKKKKQQLIKHYPLFDVGIDHWDAIRYCSVVISVLNKDSQTGFV